MNETVNKFFLAGGTFMPEMHLKRPNFTYSTCGPYAKNKRIEKIRERRGARYIYRNNNLPRRTASDKVLRDEEFNIVSNPQYDRYQRVLASMVCKFFDNKLTVGAIKLN